MRYALVVLALIGGCRLRFDEASQIDAELIAIDAPPGHDEDGDGVPDISDNCPHVPGAQTDSDGDQVGDLCDPEPGNPRQRLVVFDPLVNKSAFIEISGAWIENGDVLRCVADGVYCQLRRPFAFQDGVVEFGLDVVNRIATATQHQATFSVVDTTTQPFYYVEAFESGSTQYAAVSHFDGTMFAPLSQQTLTNGVHVGAMRLRFTVTPGAPDLAMYIDWPGEPYQATVTAPTPAYTGGPAIKLGISGLTADIRYLVVIATM